MASEPCTDSVPDANPVSGPRDKVRLQFRKDGSLRWLSHHDLMRTFERVLRRSGLPVRTTRGFNPRPRVVFALSLPLGVIGRAELVEIELDELVDPEVVFQQVASRCPPGLMVQHATRIPVKSSARVIGFRYGICIPVDRVDSVRAAVSQALACEEYFVDRTRPSPRRVNIRPFVRHLHLDESSRSLEMDLWLTNAGTARPEEVLRLLGVADLLEAGIPLERFHLDLADKDSTSEELSTTVDASEKESEDTEPEVPA